jgi:hypothetical protein
LAAIAVDGKTSRGARAAGGHAPHLVATVTHTGVVLGQRQVVEKSNEITAFQPLLKDLPLAGVVVTADALYRIRYNASYADAWVMPAWARKPLVGTASGPARSP